ncbi:hypothetical protein [Butyricimonas hominis]|jgi:lipoprotein|uniref:Lipoprotein n=1 Tax=Butyricimonas hominis TaxID=2763032 RepID=A0ABR7D3W2_9BACT|nr:hypothetical protein [Butyricimonas hominis]MBC5622589.1 hypothetical protein [Butyricimonas hominis]
MKYKYLLFWLFTAIVLTFVVSCSEDDIVPKDLSNLQYELPRGEPGSLEEMIYGVYERYGTYILYDFDESVIRTRWTLKWSGWYAPVKPGNEERVKKMVTFLQENLFNGYTDDFVRRNLVYYIFLVDSVQPPLSSKYPDMAVDDHRFIIANIGVQLDDYNDARWTSLRTDLISNFTLGFYEAASIKPTQFIASRTPGMSLGIPSKNMDPLGEYDDYTYMFYLEGFVKWKNLAHGNSNSLTPDEAQDFADYITFLTNNTKTELTNVFNRFERMKERALILVPYLNNILELNVVATQNKNCPEDPIPENFFSQF